MCGALIQAALRCCYRPLADFACVLPFFHPPSLLLPHSFSPLCSPLRQCRHSQDEVLAFHSIVWSLCCRRKKLGARRRGRRYEWLGEFTDKLWRCVDSCACDLELEQYCLGAMVHFHSSCVDVVVQLVAFDIRNMPGSINNHHDPDHDPYPDFDLNCIHSLG